MLEPLLSHKRFQELHKSILYPQDPGRVNRYVKSVWIKYQIAYYMQPASIVELGVRAGYSAWAMRLGCPQAQMTCYDNYAPNIHVDGKAIHAHAKKLLKNIGAKLVIADTQTLSKLPLVDLYHVDADHRTEPERNDIMLCLRSNPKAVLVIHDAKAAHVGVAISQARKDCKRKTCCEYIDSDWGDSIVSSEPQLWIDNIVPFDESLVKKDT